MSRSGAALEGQVRARMAFVEEFEYLEAVPAARARVRGRGKVRVMVTRVKVPRKGMHGTRDIESASMWEIALEISRQRACGIVLPRCTRYEQIAGDSNWEEEPTSMKTCGEGPTVQGPCLPSCSPGLVATQLGTPHSGRRRESGMDLTFL